MKLILAAALAMTVCSVQSQTIAKITTNQWTSDYLHVSGTLDSPTDAHLNFIGYDADKHETAHSDSFVVEKDGSFNVSFADPKREIRFVIKTISYNQQMTKNLMTHLRQSFIGQKTVYNGC